MDCVRKSIPLRKQFAREDVPDRINGYYPPCIEVSHPVTMYLLIIKNYPMGSTALFLTRRYNNVSYDVKMDRRRSTCFIPLCRSIPVPPRYNVKKLLLCSGSRCRSEGGCYRRDRWTDGRTSDRYTHPAMRAASKISAFGVHGCEKVAWQVAYLINTLRACDERTDRQTDRHTISRSAQVYYATPNMQQFGVVENSSLQVRTVGLTLQNRLRLHSSSNADQICYYGIRAIKRLIV